MLFAKTNRFSKTALEHGIHKTDIHRMAISNEGALKHRALTLETRTNTSNDEGKEIKAIYLFYKNPSTVWYHLACKSHGNIACGA